jgi:D-apionolactonase
MSPSRSIKLFGTEERAGETTALSAGALEATLDAGNLRYIKVGGKEALRAIAFLSRDRNWGTYGPTIDNLEIDQHAGGFTVTYDAICKDDTQAFKYTARIEGKADGSLTFSADGEALTDFVTNRTGFVVLHPLAGVVGQPVAVEHTDGRIVDSTFPELIDPACPFEYVRSLTHEISPGLKVACRMEGDAFEMEDHRNWMDASYKTYVRPLALPWPYTIGEGETTRQSVTLKLEGTPASSAAGGDEGVRVSVGGPNGHRMPRMGLAVPAEHAAAALAQTDLLKSAGASYLVCHFDPRKGHDTATMQAFSRLGAALGAELVLEAVVPCVDEDGNPSADPDILSRDMAAIADAAAGVPFTRVAVSPATDLNCTLPGSVFPPAPTWAGLFAEARAAFPGAAVGGGMFSYFTELNRKRPPAELLDFICHTGSPIVHAGDDVSVTETLEALPSIFKSVRAFGGGKPYWVFPTAIGMRDNPYGAAPAENPNNIRQAMNRVDPRERGLLGAAWYAGYLAHAAQAGVDAVTLAAVAGPSGIVYTKQPYAQPWFDEAGAAAMPLHAVIGGHAALQGAEVLASEISSARDVQALAVSQDGGTVLWLTNLTGKPQTVRVDGASGSAKARVLDEASFEAACQDPKSLAAAEVDLGSIALGPYAVAEIRIG